MFLSFPLVDASIVRTEFHAWHDEFIGSFKTRALWLCKAFRLGFESFIWSCGSFCLYRSHRFCRLLSFVNFHRFYCLTTQSFIWFVPSIHAKEERTICDFSHLELISVSCSRIGELKFMVRRTGPKPRESNINMGFVIIQAWKNGIHMESSF